MSERNLWRWSAVAGLGVVIIGVLFGRITGLAQCTPPPGVSPIIAFEIARGPAQIAALIGTTACAMGQHTAGWLDALGFIPVYAAFLILAALAAGGRFAKIAVAAVVAAALFDEIEGVQLFRILGSLPGTPDMFAILIPVVRAKFALLGLAVLLIGGRIVQRRGIGMAAGAAIVAGGALTVVSVMDDSRVAIMTLGATISWMVLLGYAAVRGLIPVRAATP